MSFDNLTLTKTKRKFLVQKRFLDDEVEAKFSNIMRTFESYSYDCSLNDIACNAFSIMSADNGEKLGSQVTEIYTKEP